MSQRTLIFAFKKGSELVSGTFRDITDAEFEKRLADLGYVEPKWYEFWKSRVVINVLNY
jgi:hypothetical protein